MVFAGAGKMGMTVIPAYRVVSKFLKEDRELPYDEWLDGLMHKVRRYVRHQLSAVHPSFTDLGERAAITQLGDPNPEALGRALKALEAGSVKEAVEVALRRCGEALPRPDLDARVIILPGDGDSRVLVQRMHGVMGFSLGSQAMLFFLWPAHGWQKWLTYTVSHEYTHLVRNHLFPRGMVGGSMVYLKSQAPETLLDAMVAEGISDAFAMDLCTDLQPPWTDALKPDLEAYIWPKVRRRLKVTDATEIRRILFGDGDRIPQWAGYTIGYKMVRDFLTSHPGVRPATLVGLLASAIFEASNYGVVKQSS